MDKIALKAETRTVLGKKVKVMRREGKMPAVVHERGKDSLHIAADSAELVKVWSHAGKNHVVDLMLDGKNKTVMFKEVSHDPVRGTINHVTLNVIKQNEAVTTEVAVVIIGDIPAVLKSLYVSHPTTEIEIKALPADLPEAIEVDGTSLSEVGDILKVEDIKTDSKITILTEGDRVLAVVEDPEARAAAAEAETLANAEQSASEVPADNGAAGGEVAESTEAKSE